VDELGYWLCYPEARAHLAPLASFRDWLQAELRPAAESSLPMR